MAVQLPSDIVADVMRSADPVRRLAATKRLESAGEPLASQFANLVGNSKLPGVLAADSLTPGDSCKDGMGAECHRSEVYRDFEQVVLRNLFEVLLPTQETGAFGGGPSAGVWRSMAAEELAGAVVDGGGIGIGKMLASAPDSNGLRREGQWPYFSRDSIDSFKA